MVLRNSIQKKKKEKAKQNTPTSVEKRSYFDIHRKKSC